MTKTLWRGFEADTANMPQDRAGLYVIIHIASGRAYVGIASRMSFRLSGHGVRRSNTIISRSLRKYGRAAFRVTPLAYAIGDAVDWLAAAETAMIVTLGTLTPTGFNVRASHSGVGQAGPAFSAILKAAWAVPGRTERLSAAMRAHHGTPEYKAKQSLIMLRGRSSPVRPWPYVKVERAKIEPPKAVRPTPYVKVERKETERMAVNRGSFWITDGVANRRVHTDPPPGWRRGRTS